MFSFMMRSVPSHFCQSCGLIDQVHHILAEFIRSDGIRSRLNASCSFHIGLYNPQCLTLYPNLLGNYIRLILIILVCALLFLTF